MNKFNNKAYKLEKGEFIYDFPYKDNKHVSVYELLIIDMNGNTVDLFQNWQRAKISIKSYI